MPTQEKREANTGFSPKLFSVFIFAVVFTVFSGALENGFVDWDDGDYILENRFIRSFSLDNLKEMFTDVQTANWHPVTWLSHAVDYKLFGLDPAGHHLTGIILHALNSVWVYFLFLRLAGAARPGWSKDTRLYLAGFAVALLFGCHPLRVESAVWASERKDLLSAFFILPAFLAYLSYAGSKDPTTRRRWYTLVVFLFILALMSKSMVVTFPVALLVLDAFLLRRITDGKTFILMLWEKVPLFFLSVISGVIAIFTQSGSGAMVPVETLALGDRLMNAVRSVAFYIGKTFWPDSLVPLYPFPKGLSLGDPRFFLAFAVIAGLSIFCLVMWKRGRLVWIAAWLYYLVTVMPVIGILQVGRQGAADRYTYLPTLSFYFLAGAGALWLLKKYSGTSRARASLVLFLAAGGLALGGLVMVTDRQIGVWRNTETFAESVLEVYPDSVPMAHFKIARIYKDRGWRARAKREFFAAIKINPNYTLPLNDLGLMAMEEGRLDEAEAFFRSGIALSPDHIFHTNLGSLFMRRKQYRSAQEHFLIALDAKPGYADAHNNLGMAYIHFGKFGLAEDHFNLALENRPNFVQAMANLGVLYKKTGYLPKAEARFYQALALDPVNPDILNALGEVYLKAGLNGRAIKVFKAALRLMPDHVRAKANLQGLLPPEN